MKKKKKTECVIPYLPLLGRRDFDGVPSPLVVLGRDVDDPPLAVGDSLFVILW